MFMNALFNGIFQVVLFTIIPFVWWLITARKKENFFQWIGIKLPKTEDKKKWGFMLLLTFVICFVAAQFAIFMRGEMEAADSQYKGMGAIAIPSIVIYAFIQTAMSEEILFRGFLLKRLVSKFGFTKGNIIQAVIFGAVHILMVWGHTTFWSGLVIVAYPMIVALLLAYINEKKSNGSILPSWLVHGMLNTVQGILSAL